MWAQPKQRENKLFVYLSFSFRPWGGFNLEERFFGRFILNVFDKFLFVMTKVFGRYIVKVFGPYVVCRRNNSLIIGFCKLYSRRSNFLRFCPSIFLVCESPGLSSYKLYSCFQTVAYF